MLQQLPAIPQKLIAIPQPLQAIPLQLQAIPIVTAASPIMPMLSAPPSDTPAVAATSSWDELTMSLDDMVTEVSSVGIVGQCSYDTQLAVLNEQHRLHLSSVRAVSRVNDDFRRHDEWQAKEHAKEPTFGRPQVY